MKGKFRRRQAVRQTVCLVSKPKGPKLSPSSPQESGALSGRWSAVHTVQYPIILHILPVFKPVFLLSRVWQQNGLNAAAGLCLPPANLRRQLHIGNGMGLGTEAESPNVRWGSGGKDGSLR